jgi:Spy/CpxP family protein refolding chaperone
MMSEYSQKTMEEQILQAVRHDWVCASPSKWRAVVFVAAVVLAGLFTTGEATAMASFQRLGMRRHARGQMPSVDDQVKRMAKQLSLNDDQQQKLKPILEDQRQQMQQLRNDSSLSQDEKFNKMRDVHEKASSQIKALLNEDQQKKFDEMQQKHRERWESRRGGASDKE